MGDKTRPATLAKELAAAIVSDVRAQGGSEATPQLAKSVASELELAQSIASGLIDGSGPSGMK